MDPRQWYEEQLDVINRISDSLCRRNCVQSADAEDFAADVRLKLLQDDFAVLRKYRGDCSRTTFLTVVISNLFRDYRIKQWGKWRASAEAKKLGEVAVKLEALLYRDYYTFEQACAVLSQDGSRPVDRAELQRLRKALPHRMPRRPNEDKSPEDIPAPESADDPVLDHERSERMQAAKAALERAIGRLPADDRVIVRLHFYEGLSMADVARAGGFPQKPLYTRMKRLLEILSKDLAAQGIGPEYREWLNSTPP